MPEQNQSPEDVSTYGTDAGMPVEQAQQKPSEAELDERNRLMSLPRRPQGPPLHEDPEASMLASEHEPPPATEPMSGETHAVPGSSTHISDAGRPAEHAGPKPSHDELDRRDRLMSGVRRAQGPPLRDDREEAMLEEAPSEAVAPTDPKEPHPKEPHPKDPKEP